jgi:hypothetical protein
MGSFVNRLRSRQHGMRPDVRALIAFTALSAAFVALPNLAAQSGSGAVSKQAAPASKETTSGSASKKWRTEFGAPDIQGTWTFQDDFMAPLEKPAGDVKTYASEEEALTAFKRMLGEVAAPAYWFEPKALSSPRWLVRTPDGKIPPLTPWAKEQAAYRRAHHDDSWEFMHLFERCMSRGVPGAMLPTGVFYNGAVEITQTPQLAALHFEMFDTWLVPLDGRPHLGNGVRLLTGDPRGHWEGETLVIDVTNFNSQSQPLVIFLGSDSLHVVERLTRLDENTLDFDATIEDPKVFTASWRVGLRLKREPTYRMFEFACHEGNYGLANTLSAARTKEREALKKPGNP